MTRQAALAAVDWGTSSFRLWLMSQDGTVLAETRSDEGLLSIKKEKFAATLEQRIVEAGGAKDLPAIICGMAGSRHGWVEAGYLPVPADLGKLASNGTIVSGIERPVSILPGVCIGSPDEPDVMRGEETQLYGAAFESHGEGRYCVPGTHSKWVTMESTRIIGFQTFMTGELFSVIASQTILKHSVGDGAVQANDPAFITGVRDGWTNAARLSHFLFSLRAAHLLHDRPPPESRARLSGLLIGAELAGAGITGSDSVALVASGNLQGLYHAALLACGAKVRTIDADIAVQRGLFEAWSAMASRPKAHPPAA